MWLRLEEPCGTLGPPRLDTLCAGRVPTAQPEPPGVDLPSRACDCRWSAGVEGAGGVSSNQGQTLKSLSSVFKR